MEHPFPLYSELNSKQLEAPIEPCRLSAIINSLSTDKAEIIYVLILHHYRLNDSSEKTKRSRKVTPYGGKPFPTGKGIVYPLNQLPGDLLQVITKYLMTVGK